MTQFADPENQPKPPQQPPVQCTGCGWPNCSCAPGSAFSFTADKPGSAPYCLCHKDEVLRCPDYKAGGTGGWPLRPLTMTEVEAIRNAALPAVAQPQPPEEDEAAIAEAAQAEALTRLHAKDMRARSAAKAIVAAEEAAQQPRSWQPVDHDEAFKATTTELIPTVGSLTVGRNDMPLALFYPGKVSGINGESEVGKGWCLGVCTVQQLRLGHHVNYIDPEDDAGSVYQRLIDLGATEQQIREYFHYVSPAGPLAGIHLDDYRELLERRGSLHIIDGVTEAMSLNGLDGRHEKDVAAFHALMTKPAAALGWAVVIADHLPHDGQRAIGSQHKKSAITGVSYLLEGVHPIAPGLRGVTRIRVAKDRCGWIRGQAALTKGSYADLVVDSRPERNGVLSAHLYPVSPKSEGADQGFDGPPRDKLEAVLGYCAAHPEATSKEAIRSQVRGNGSVIGVCVDWLVAQGYLDVKRDGTRRWHAPTDKPLDLQ